MPSRNVLPNQPITGSSPHASGGEIARLLTEAALPVVASFGLELWGVEVVGAGRPVARVYVDVPAGQSGGEPEGEPVIAPDVMALASTQEGHDDDPAGVSAHVSPHVSVDQCAEISRLVGLALDVEDVFPEAWVLEVSSPGLERPFFRPEQLAWYVGRELDVTLREPHPDFPGRRKFRGRLTKVEGESIFLSLEAAGNPRDMVFRWNEARKVRLIHIFPDTSRPGQGGNSRSGKRAGASAGQGGGNKA